MNKNFLENMTTAVPPYARPISSEAQIAPGLARWVPRDFGPFPVGTRVNILAWRESEKDRGVSGTVIGYEVCCGYLMIWVKPDWRPEWHVKDNPGRWAGLFAGIELEPA